MTSAPSGTVVADATKSETQMARSICEHCYRPYLVMFSRVEAMTRFGTEACQKCKRQAHQHWDPWPEKK